MVDKIMVLAALLLAGCAHGNNNSPDTAAPPPGTLEAYCQQDGNILSIQAPQGSSTRCEHPPTPPKTVP